MRRSFTLVVISAAVGACGSSPGTSAGTCATTVAAYCASAGPGVCTWPGPTPSASECSRTLRNRSCGAYDAVLLQGVDSGSVRYYDMATRSLAAVVSYGIVPPRRTCTVGPPSGFTEPTCDGAAFTPSCPDAGP